MKFLKKRRLEASLLFNLELLNRKDNKLSIINIIDNKRDFAKTWFWNESANKTISNFKEKDYNNVNENDLKK